MSSPLVALPDAETTFHQLLPAAQALRPEEVVPMRVDPEIAHGNVQTGVAAVLPLQAALQPQLPALDWHAIAGLPAVGQAVIFASAQVDRHMASPGDIAKLRKRGNELRNLLMGAAQALADKGLLPADEIEAIRRGAGPIDHATDCVRLAGQFRTHQVTIAGKHAVDAAEIDEAATTGTQLLAVLRPAGHRAGAGEPTAADRAADVRDRMWTLLVQGYAAVRKAAYYQWQDEFDDHAPALGARKLVRKPAVVTGGDAGEG